MSPQTLTAPVPTTSRRRSELRQRVEQFIDEIISSPEQSDWASSGSSGIAPAFNIVESKDGYAVFCELPGCKSNDVNVSVDEQSRTLSLRAERTTGHSGMGSSGSGGSEFYRTEFTLPNNVEIDKIRAKYENGMLTLVLPWGATSRGKQISIT